MDEFISKIQTPMLRSPSSRRGVLICFTGIDGSGKSSHAKSLFRYLTARGYSCSYRWGGIKMFLSYFFFALTRLLGYWKEEQLNGEYSVNPIGNAPKRIRERALIPLFRFCIFADFQIKTLLKVRLPLLFGKTVILDRYVYDLVVGLKTSGLSTDAKVKLFLQTVPSSNLVFFLDAPVSVISARRSSPTADIQRSKRNYLLLARSSGFCILDSSNDFSKNQLEIRRRVSQCLGDTKMQEEYAI